MVAASIIDDSSVDMKRGELTDDGDGYMEDVADMGDWAILGMILWRSKSRITRSAWYEAAVKATKLFGRTISPFVFTSTPADRFVMSAVTVMSPSGALVR